MSEVALDGGGRFSPTGIDGLLTLSLLSASQAAHDRAVGNVIEHTIEHVDRLTTGYSNPRQRGINSVPL